jgi:regulator of sirC expression with transglutaminase-like and TPR domain
VGARIFIRLVTEWASLYHHNDTSLDLEISVPSVDLRAGGHPISRGSIVLAIASSLGLPENGLACTIIMRPVLISKF